MSWSPEPKLEPKPEPESESEPEPELERDSPTWWTRDPERSMNERYEAWQERDAGRKCDTRMTPARSPTRLPRERSPARFPRVRSHARITSDLLDDDTESDDEDFEEVGHAFRTCTYNDDEDYREPEEDLSNDDLIDDYSLATPLSSPIVDGLPLQEAEETSPVADPYVGGDQSSYGGGGNNDDSDEVADVQRERLSGSRVSSPVAEINPQLDPSDAISGGDDSYGGGNNDYSNVEANVSGSRAASPIPEISPQVDPAGAVVGGGGDDDIYGGGNDDINKIDVCPICYEPWTCDGRHRTCCLPCGHIYGLSCIKNWLELAQGSGKCPQCKRACTLNDVRVLYATRLCAADEVNEAPTTHFPFTEEGFSAFQHYVFSRNEALEQRVDALEQRVNAFDHRPDSLEQRVHALEEQVDEMLP